MELDAGDLAFRARDAELLAVVPEIPCIQPGIEVEGVAQIGQGRAEVVHACAHELVFLAGQQIDRVVVQPIRLAGLVGLQPVVVEVHQASLAPQAAKAVDVGLPLRAPVLELDAQLEGRLGPAHELVFVDADQVIELDDRWNRRLTDADRGYLVGLDQLNLGVLAQRVQQHRSRHPAGSAAADDQDLLQAVLTHHRTSSTSFEC